MVAFFFQAEDGIRVAQESRGLVDVYKRQGNIRLRLRRVIPPRDDGQVDRRVAVIERGRIPVSYTHLTLPTIYSV